MDFRNSIEFVIFNRMVKNNNNVPEKSRIDLDDDVEAEECVDAEGDGGFEEFPLGLAEQLVRENSKKERS
ncbi:MAG TPA: hypothetical protein PKA53_02125 [Sphingobacterium sp.]|nr:hypothetical protein [Sphingobacterium sp.]